MVVKLVIEKLGLYFLGVGFTPYIKAQERNLKNNKFSISTSNLVLALQLKPFSMLSAIFKGNNAGTQHVLGFWKRI